MAKDLGIFGTSHEADEEETFQYFGTPIRINPEASSLDYMDFMEVAASVEYKQGDDEATAKANIKAIIAIKDYLRSLIHEDDFDTFWALSKKHRQQLDDLMKLSQDLMAAVTGVPTKESRDSAHGDSSTDSNLKVGSYTPSEEEAFKLLEGREDLQRALMLRIEARSGRSTSGN